MLPVLASLLALGVGPVLVAAARDRRWMLGVVDGFVVVTIGGIVLLHILPHAFLVGGVVTLALALSVPESFPGRDTILVMAFAVILVTVLVQGASLGRVIAWLQPQEVAADKPRMTLNQAEASMAQVQLATVRTLAGMCDAEPTW